MGRCWNGPTCNWRAHHCCALRGKRVLVCVCAVSVLDIYSFSWCIFDTSKQVSFSSGKRRSSQIGMFVFLWEKSHFRKHGHRRCFRRTFSQHQRQTTLEIVEDFAWEAKKPRNLLRFRSFLFISFFFIFSCFSFIFLVFSLNLGNPRRFRIFRFVIFPFFIYFKFVCLFVRVCVLSSLCVVVAVLL